MKSRIRVVLTALPPPVSSKKSSWTTPGRIILQVSRLRGRSRGGGVDRAGVHRADERIGKNRTLIVTQVIVAVDQRRGLITAQAHDVGEVRRDDGAVDGDGFIIDLSTVIVPVNEVKAPVPAPIRSVIAAICRVK